MEYIENKEIVVIFNKRMGLETVVSKLALLNGEQMKRFFMERPIKIPRKLNAMALTGTLNERIKTLDSHSLTKDAFANLEYYSTFTEFQLQNLFEKIGTEEDFYLYRKNLWKLLICNNVGVNLQDGEVTRLINMKKYRVEDFVTYSSCIAQVSLDVAKEFDASPISKFEEVLKVAFSQEEIRTLAHKYGFDIPARLKKEDLLQYVKDMMRAKRKLTLALQRELKDMTLVQLNNFCSLQNLGISSYLKKEELIHLLLFLFKQAKFPTIEANNILGMSFTDPIKFRVDLDVVDNFKRGLPKKVIYLEGEEALSIADLEEIEEVVEPAPKKRHTKDDMITEIVKKLLPYLNIDEETARLAIEHGLVEENLVKKTSAPKTANKPEQKKKTRAR